MATFHLLALGEVQPNSLISKEGARKNTRVRLHHLNEEKTTGFHLTESIVRSKLGRGSSDETYEEISLVGGITADSVLSSQRRLFSMVWGSSESASR